MYCTADILEIKISLIKEKLMALPSKHIFKYFLKNINECYVNINIENSVCFHNTWNVDNLIILVYKL